MKFHLNISRFLYSIFLVIVLFIMVVNPSLVDASILKYANNESSLINKVSKDYTRKFCNGIGFGLSKDSAMIFALKENNEVFLNRKGIDLIDKDLLADQIAVSVMEKCGYPINLSGEKGIKEFKEFYIESSDKILLSNK